MSEEQTTETKKEPRRGLLGWLLASNDQLSIGPTVPARVRTIWGILVLAGISWIVILLHVLLADVSEQRRDGVHDENVQQEND